MRHTRPSSATPYPGMAHPQGSLDIPEGSAVKTQPHSLYPETLFGQSPRHSSENFYLGGQGGFPSSATTISLAAGNKRTRKCLWEEGVH